MKPFHLLLLVALALPACHRADPANPAPNAADVRFDGFKNRFIAGLWRYQPDFAAAQGFHKYDSLLLIPDAAQRAREAQYFRLAQDTLVTFFLDGLSPNNQTDYRILDNQFRSARWYADTLREWQWNPAAYNVGAGVGDLLNGRHAPLAVRLRHISARLAAAPAYYAAARANLVQPTREHATLAVGQNQGGAAVLTGPLTDSVRVAALPEAEKQLLTQRIAGAQAAIAGYVGWLQTDVLKRPQLRNYRIGAALFDRKFHYDIQSKFSASEVYARALTRKTELLRDMGRRAARLFPTYCPGQTMPADTLQLIRQVLAQLTKKHAPREGFVAAVKQQIPTLVAFVNEHKLLTQDPSKPLVVRESPLYMRGGGAGASISAPGPYDKNADTYYNVEPIAASQTAAQAESYLREYNDYTLQILNIHEAIPGHYTQLVYANRSPSLVKSIFGNGAMIEGWAVYTERMMLEEGYGNQSDEMWLLWNKWNLRVTLNTVLDRAVQANNIAEADGKRMLMAEGFQEAAEADGKWRRATLSQAQLSSYFTGYTEIYALREELKKQQGKGFDLKQFHEKFLSFGSAPVQYIGELMRGDAALMRNEE